MEIYSEDKIFARLIEKYLENPLLCGKIPDDCVIIDLDTSGLTKEAKKAVTFSYFAERSPDLVRPFPMTELAEILGALNGKADESIPAERSRAENEGNEEKSGHIPQEDAEEFGFVLSEENGTVSYRGEKIFLTEKEYLILRLLLSRRGEPVSRSEIISEIWKSESPDSNVVDVFVRYLRKKLDFRFGERIIYASRGYGYFIK